MPDESLLQTVTRNLTPAPDTSKSALGKGGMFTPGDSPQKEGETQYTEKFGSPQEVAYGKLKNWLSEHEQHFSDKVLKPFREGLDNMADQMENSPVTKAASPTAQGVAKGTAELLRAVPVGKDVKETAAANVLDFSGLEGHVLEEAAPEYAYRARDVGETGVPAEARSHAQATMSADEAKMYLEHRGKTTGKPQELVRFDVNKLDPEHYVRKAGPGTADWVKLNRELKESEIEKVPEKPAKGSEPDNEREIRTRTQGRPSKPTEPSPQTEQPADHSKLIAQVNKKDWWHVPPAEGNAAYQKRGQFFSPDYKTAEFYGRPLDDAQKVQIQKPLVGDEQTIAKELGIPPQKEGMTREQIAAHDEKWAKAAKQKGYDSIALMSPQGWADYQKTGKVPKDVELNTLHQVGSNTEKKITAAKEGLGK